MKAEEYIEIHYEELKQLLCEMVQIPAPSYHEKERAIFIQKWLSKNGYENEVTIDEKYNVIVDRSNPNDDIYLVMAHIDTVFTDLKEIILKEDETYLYAAGIGDDGANVAIVLFLLKYMKEYSIHSKNYVFVLNVCEEGLGNLNGSKAIYQRYGNRIKQMISFDCYYNEIFNKAVGSIRYQIDIHTKGGHSYFDFPSKNAIVEAGQLIDKLYHLAYQPIHKTTYNVGMIEGGTSVNTIAQHAHFLFEIRSEDYHDLTMMRQLAEKTIHDANSDNVAVLMEIIGERPCMKDVNEQMIHEMCKQAQCAIRSVYDGELLITSGSTDCNWFLNKGIPSICFGLCMGDGVHTLEEKLEKESLKKGFIIAYHYLFNH